MAKSFSQLTNLFQTLSLNSTPANGTLGSILINDQHRYLLLKYFNNEGIYTMLTVGPQDLTVTNAALPAGATSATLTTAWPNLTCQQLTVFPDGEQRTVFYTLNSTNIYWISALNAVQTSATIGCQGVQSYPLPVNVSKIKNATITIGQLVYSPAPVQSIQEWTRLNALPYASSIPAYFYIYNNQLNFWPIPATTGEVITLYCQIAIPDMTYADYTAGTISSASVGSTAVVGSGTTWTGYPQNTDLTFANLFMTIQPPGGDGLPYPIQYFSSGTSATLIKPLIYAPNTSGATYTIGQYPLLDADFHDMLVYGALRIYFSSIVKDADKYQLYNTLFQEKMQLAEMYLSTKQVNVDLSVTPIQSNPNLYVYPTSN